MGSAWLVRSRTACCCDGKARAKRKDLICLLSKGQTTEARRARGGALRPEVVRRFHRRRERWRESRRWNVERLSARGAVVGAGRQQKTACTRAASSPYEEESERVAERRRAAPFARKLQW